MRTTLIAALLLSPACALLPNPSPHEVRVECQLLPQEPTEENPNPPDDPCLPWRPEVVTRALIIHRDLWRATFPDTDEWAAEAPLLPHTIVIVDTDDVCGPDLQLAGCSDRLRSLGKVGALTRAVGDVWIAAKDPRNGGLLADSVLGHELVHVALVGAHGDGDRDHEEGEGPWTEAHNAYILELQGALQK